MLRNQLRAINNYKFAVILTLYRSEAEFIIGKLEFSRTNKTISHCKRNEVVKSCLQGTMSAETTFYNFKTIGG